jgi:GT2 family glycosyltransferase
MVAWDRAEGKARPSMDLSVVIPTYNQADLLKESLRSLVDQMLSHGSYEIVVVDDGSTDHTATVLREFGPPVRVVRLPTNRGRSAARNAGIRAAAAPLVALVDSDIIVRRDFLASHLEAHKRHGNGILSRGPVIDVPDLATARDDKIPKLVSSPAYLTTANAALAKDALLRAGLFDEHFPGYGWEDFDLGLRLRRLGLRRVFCPQAVAFHVAPLDYWDDVPGLLLKEEARAKSAVYFYRKHPTLEARILIQATPLHRALYWLQCGCGALSPANVAAVVSWLRRRNLMLAQIALRGVLNRHYLQTLRRGLKQYVQKA